MVEKICGKGEFWDEKDLEPSKNEPNQNPGFVKNWTEQEPEKNV